MEKSFAELKAGDRFTLNGIEYIKTEDVRVSCCRVVNAYSAADASQTMQFAPETRVVVNG